MNNIDFPVIDGHAHIFQRTLRLADDRRYTPDRDATLPDYLEQLDRHAVTHGVLVQPSFLGCNNDYLLGALKTCPERLRGVAVVEPDIGEDMLARLAGGGVVGIRLNMPGKAMPDFRQGAWPLFLARLERLALHVEVHCAARDLVTLLPALLGAGVQVVVDHFGRPDGPMDAQDPGFRCLLDAGRTGRVWVKLSAGYRLGSAGGSPFAGPEVVQRLTDGLGVERLVWGSDWPHTEWTGRMDFGGARRLLDHLVPDPRDRHHILGASAKALFRF